MYTLRGSDRSSRIMASEPCPLTGCGLELLHIVPGDPLLALGL